MSSMSGTARRTLQLLKTLELATPIDEQHWALTPAGEERARRVINEQFGGVA